MSPQILKEHIQKCKSATSEPFGVNVPLLYSGIHEQMKIILEENVQIVFTSAGNPAVWTKQLKDKGITVVHVVSSKKFAMKAEAAGCDAVVAEGFEAGGHNGREETTTMVLLPLVCNAVNIPVIAAGGVATGRQMLAAMVLGAEGVQVGSRYAASTEGSSHENFKNAIINAQEGDTMLTMKQITPVRMIKNKFYQQIVQAEEQGNALEPLKDLAGKGRARKGMFEGDMIEGELEIGQVSALINKIQPAAEITHDLWDEFSHGLAQPLK